MLSEVYARTKNGPDEPPQNQGRSARHSEARWITTAVEAQAGLITYSRRGRSGHNEETARRPAELAGAAATKLVTHS
jgi:hypothetical protein